MRARPTTPEQVVDVIVTRVVALDSRRARVVVDGAPPSDARGVADALVPLLRAAGRPVVRVRAADFLRPASLRYEHGHHDPEALWSGWLDEGALAREVLEPFVQDGWYLPDLWDAERDRATRSRRRQAPDRAVLVLDGSLLLGRGLATELTVHLSVRADTLARRTAPADRWKLPAYRRYARQVDPERVADVVVRVDDPRHPALVLSAEA